jgi:hypothetical protein
MSSWSIYQWIVFWVALFALGYVAIELWRRR